MRAVSCSISCGIWAALALRLFIFRSNCSRSGVLKSVNCSTCGSSNSLRMLVCNSVRMAVMSAISFSARFCKSRCRLVVRSPCLTTNACMSDSAYLSQSPANFCCMTSDTAPAEIAPNAACSGITPRRLKRPSFNTPPAVITSSCSRCWSLPRSTNRPYATTAGVSKPAFEDTTLAATRCSCFLPSVDQTSARNNRKHICTKR